MVNTTWLRETGVGRWVTKRPVAATAIVSATAWFLGAELLAAALVGGAVTMVIQKFKEEPAPKGPAPDAPH